MLEQMPPDEVHRLYRCAGALIFPSTAESFGLPLLEAVAAGLPILASESDYVRDIVEPVQTFDPRSAVSIMRAVSRHLGVPAQRRALLDAAGFLSEIAAGAARGSAREGAVARPGTGDRLEDGK
jgi:glycosyltransferase involved in cell wall biosynthesis